MALLVGGDLLEDPAHGGIFGAQGGLAGLERRQRLADAGLADDRGDHRVEVERAERIGGGQRAGTDTCPFVQAGQREAQARVLDLVGEGLLRVLDQVGRRADGQQLQDEARERGHRGVLAQADLLPVRGQARASAAARPGRGRGRASRRVRTPAR
ncbi:hypothetical protein OV079_40855 [Nannocystis pusilla]|uniref:Uncharacterized protein n=1 Tax=Nannocystis pusilla TaxID=889268 RepID=A0A9X3J251_9BACT|nr:hypothetical protein [Nannocystis pusilla]MCY1011800.1 hypothetical protein [Nannocystis pusilla]